MNNVRDKFHDTESIYTHNVVTFKADSHIACHAHAVPLPCCALIKNLCIKLVKKTIIIQVE
jgi:hypothetical protein